MMMLTNEMNINDKNDLNAKKKKNRVVLPTIRFELTIEKPSGDSFCEFNYNKLALKVYKRCKKKHKIENKKRIKAAKSGEIVESNIEVDNFQKLGKNDLEILENDIFIDKKRIDELVSIYEKKIYLSKEADDEEKYLNDNDMDENKYFEDEEDEDDEADTPKSNNNKGPKKSKLKSAYDFDNNKYKLRDFNYLGHGYDENDSFIDNSEAQDVRVPSNMAPKRGGFYINKEEIQLEKIKKNKKSTSENRKNNDVNSSNVNKNGENVLDNNEEEEDEEDEDYSYDSEESYSSSNSNSSNDDSSDEDDDDDDDESDDESEENDINANAKSSKKKMDIDLASSNSENSRESKKRRKRMRKQIEESSNEDEDGKINANNTNKENSKIISKSSVNNGNNIATSSNCDMASNTKKRKKDDSNNKAIVDNNLILNQNLISNNKYDSSSNDNGEIKEVQSKTTNSSLIPSNISQELKDKVNKLIEIYKRQRNISPDPYTSEFKAQLFIVYNDTLKLNSQDIKSQLFNFISDSVEKNKDSLFRVCRRMKNAKINKNDNNSNQQQQQQQQHQPRQLNTNNNTYNNNNNNNLNQRSMLSSPSPSPSKPVGPIMQINSFAELEQDLQTKLNEIIRKFQQFKQQVKTDDHLKFFFENPNARNQIYMIQNQLIRFKSIRPNIKEFVVTYLSKEFGANRDDFLKKFDLTTSLVKNTNLLNKYIVELKKEIDLLMPGCWANYNQEHQKYIQNKKTEENSANNNNLNNPNDPNKKKMTAPRKRFSWSEKSRDAFRQICLSKINLLRLNGQNVNVSDENTLRDFFQAEIITLWPEAWMQMNVLLHKYQQVIVQQPQQTAQQQPQRNLQASPNANQIINRNMSNNINSNNRSTSSAPSTPVANNIIKKVANNSNQVDTISISSKSGKSVTIESFQTNKAPNLVQQNMNRTNQNGQQTQQQQKPIQNRNTIQTVQTINTNKQNIYEQNEPSNNTFQMKRQNSSSGPLNNLNKSIASSNQHANSNIAKTQTNNLVKQTQNQQIQQPQHQQHLQQIQHQTLNSYLNLHQNTNPLGHLSHVDLAKLQNFQQNPQKLNEFLLANIQGSNSNNNPFGPNNM